MASRSQAVEPEKFAKPKKFVTSKPTRESVQQAVEASVDPSQVAALAYGYWLQRGCPIGSPDVDWIRAEEELKKGQE